MSIDFLEKLPTPDELKELVPLSAAAASSKAERDAELKSIFEGKSNKFLLVIGPCSAHDPNAVCDYVARLAKLQDEVKDKLVLVPRIYTNKPRTTGEGYKGVAHQADPQGKANIAEGLKAMRSMHIKAIEASGLTPADEMLYPGNYPYLDDLLSYVAVGARSVENQEHRLTVSGLNIPSGMKNPTSGDLSIMLNSVHAAQLPHDFIYNGWRVQTHGNPYAHSILRGAVNQHGRNIPNYHFEDLNQLSDLYEKRGLKNPSIVVDTNHANSNKLFNEQIRIAHEILRSKSYSDTLQPMVKGLMIESFIEEGNQKADGNVYGKSITDPCLGWAASETLVKSIAEMA
jgi:3-deoxy-7-phosphoheptulonate synthase